MPAQENHRAAGAGNFAGSLDQFALLRGVEKLAAERYRHTPDHSRIGRGDHEQAIVGKRHEGAAMDVLGGSR